MTRGITPSVAFHYQHSHISSIIEGPSAEPERGFRRNILEFRLDYYDAWKTNLINKFPLNFLSFQIRNYEKTECHEERQKLARQIYDNNIMKEMLSHTHEYSKEAVAFVQKYLMKNEVPVNLFEPYIEEIFNHLRGEPFRKFLER